MPQHEETRLLPHSAAQLYALVADVAAYPDFLPWCSAARIRSRRQMPDCEVMEADLVISFKVFRERFGSRVTLFADRFEIQTDYLDGPFRHLHSTWRIEDLGKKECRVHFTVDFEFKSAILSGLIGLVFHEAMTRIVRAFESRAAQLYG